MVSDNGMALSPLDGRYQQQTRTLSLKFSEAALAFNRIKIECLYLQVLAKNGLIRTLTQAERVFLDSLSRLDLVEFKKIKAFEAETHHDVKAVEYYLRAKFSQTSLEDVSSFIHFGVTSEDINNLAYRLMWHEGISADLDPALKSTLKLLGELTEKYAGLPMLARTHGQAAIPTTLGKELAVYGLRLVDLLAELEAFAFKGKFNGAVGGYQAMVVAYPEIDWLKLSRELIEGMGFDWRDLTTQIAPADDLVKLCSIFQRLNLILLDLNQDIWRYISDGWLVQKGKEGFVGSSTMPQKINPIEFENSEGNLILANSLYEGMIRKLPISRLQRDLSESPVLRSVGSAFGYNLLAFQSLVAGLGKLSVDEKTIAEDLSQNYNILAEAWQTLARKNGDTQAYEKSAKMAKNKLWTKQDWVSLAFGTPLMKLTPANYLGLSEPLARAAASKINQFLDHYQFSHRKPGHDNQV